MNVCHNTFANWRTSGILSTIKTFANTCGIMANVLYRAITHTHTHYRRLPGYGKGERLPLSNNYGKGNVCHIAIIKENMANVRQNSGNNTMRTKHNTLKKLHGHCLRDITCRRCGRMICRWCVENSGLCSVCYSRDKNNPKTR